MTKRKTHFPSKKAAEVMDGDNDMPTLEFVAATSGVVIHIRLTEGSPPGILCRHNRRDITMTAPHLVLENMVVAMQMGRRCCGACWDLAQEPARRWIKVNYPELAPREARVCKARRTIE